MCHVSLVYSYFICKQFKYNIKAILTLTFFFMYDIRKPDALIETQRVTVLSESGLQFLFHYDHCSL